MDLPLAPPGATGDLPTRSVAWCVVLAILTGGIYAMFWAHRAWRETRPGVAASVALAFTALFWGIGALMFVLLVIMLRTGALAGFFEVAIVLLILSTGPFQAGLAWLYGGAASGTQAWLAARGSSGIGTWPAALLVLLAGQVGYTVVVGVTQHQINRARSGPGK